ncbi:MAG TPA: Uma2 family endonuclease [Terriglobia bacterium]|nr:Uma2 family endonuclease [Terriglobia bacterium]
MGTDVIPKLTYEQFRELPDDGKRYELIRGEVHLTPSPTTKHQSVLQNLAQSLGPFVLEGKLGEVWTAPLDVRLGEDTALQPDLIFVSESRANIILESYIHGAPDLVVEILSPSTAAHDRATKLALYGEAGVPEVWLIDPQAKTVEILKLQGKKYLVDAALAGDAKLTSTQFPGWELSLIDLFDFRGRF